MPTDDRTREAKIRERFEAWGCQQRGYPFPLAFAKLGSDYKYSDIRLCWRCWQAAYDEGREEGLEQAEEEIGGELYGHDTGEMGNGYRRHCATTRSSLRSEIDWREPMTSYVLTLMIALQVAQAWVVPIDPSGTACSQIRHLESLSRHVPSALHGYSQFF